MPKGRLEAFSDGVLAIIITIMVLELKVPHGRDLTALRPLLPVFLSYVLSFVYVGIYWNNHHHMLQVTKHVTGLILWANSPSVVLVVTLPVRNGVDGGESLRRCTDSDLRERSVASGRRLLSVTGGHPSGRRARLRVGDSCRCRFQGEGIAAVLRDRNSPRLCQLMDRQRALRCGCLDVVSPGPSH